jgi:hypothetical protein
MYENLCNIMHTHKTAIDRETRNNAIDLILPSYTILNVAERSRLEEPADVR